MVGKCSHLDAMDDTLYVISMVSNPARFSRRYHLFEEYCVRMRRNPQVHLITIEVALGDRPYCTSATLKIRSPHQLWIKENALNIAARTLPEDAKYIAFIDTDIEFLQADWVSETIHSLQVYDVVFPWENAIDHGPSGEILQVHTSFGKRFIDHGNRYVHNEKIYGVWHPGYAIAFRRDAYNTIGGLFELDILGSGDRTTAMALVGVFSKHVNSNMTERYKATVMAYEKRCQKLNNNIGYTSGSIRHYWHGRKSLRGYATRWSVLIENKYDPLTDVHKDTNGLLQLTEDKPKLRDQIRAYFHARNDDSVDLE